jgi:hypothetical protein
MTEVLEKALAARCVQRRPRGYGFEAEFLDLPLRSREEPVCAGAKWTVRECVTGWKDDDKEPHAMLPAERIDPLQRQEHLIEASLERVLREEDLIETVIVVVRIGPRLEERVGPPAS